MQTEQPITAGNGRILFRMVHWLSSGLRGVHQKCRPAFRHANARYALWSSLVRLGGWTAVWAALLAVLLPGSTAFGAVTWSGELLTNPGFESGLAGWTNGGGGSAVANTKIDWWDDGPHSGSKQAYWVDTDPAYYLYQNVDLSAYATDIDAGNAVISATGYLISNEYHVPAYDVFYMKVIFRDASGTEIAGHTYDTGEMNVQTWAQYGLTSYAIPAGTRSVQIRFNTREEGGWDAGSADDFSVKVGIDSGGVGSSGVTRLDGSWHTGLTGYTAPAGSNRILVFVSGLEADGARTISSVTYGGVVMTRAIGYATTATGYIALTEIWYLKDAAIPAGSNNFAVTYSSAPAGSMHAAATYSGVDQNNPVFDTSQKEDSTSPVDDPLSATLDVTADGYAIAGISCGNDGTYIWNSGWSAGASLPTNTGGCSMATVDQEVSATGSVTASANHSSSVNRHVMAMVSLRPVAAIDVSGLAAKTGTFAAKSGTGSQSISGLGFRPKAALFWITNLTATGSSNQSYFGRGWTDGSGQGAVATAFMDGGNETQDRVVNTKCITLIDEYGTLLAEAGITSLDSDGFTVNWSTPGGSRIVSYLALGGDALTNVKAGGVNLSTFPQAVTGVGFQPDAVLFAGVQNQTSWGNSSRGGHAFGVALSPTDRHTSSHRHMDAGTAGTSGYTTDQALVPADDTTTPEGRYDLQSMDSDGFTIVRDAGTARTATIYLALKGVEVKRGILTQPTASGSQSVTGLGFQPQVVMFDGGDKAVTNAWQSGAEMVHGVADATSQSAIWIGRNGTASDTELSTIRVIRSLTAGTPTVNADAFLSSFGADGFTLQWPAVDATQRKIGWVALGYTAPNNYMIMAMPGMGGSIFPSGLVSVNEGASQQFTITPDAGYEIGEVMVDFSPVTLTDGTYTFTNVTADHNIDVSFAPLGGFEWGTGSFNYRKTITIDHTKVGASCAADLSAFPVLISLSSDANLKSVANGGHVESDSGYDIVFKDAGDNPLYHEIESYNQVSGTLVAWVRIPTLPRTADTVIYMYYGNSAITSATQNPTAVWDSDFAAVWHLHQAPGGANDVPDSTGNNNRGTTQSMEAGDLGAGKIGNGLTFDGGEYLSVPNSTSLNVTSQLTMEAWVNLTNADNDQKVMGKTDSAHTSGYLLGVGTGNLYPEIWNSAGTHYSFQSGSISSSQWAHLAITWTTSGNMIGYVNGSQVNSISAGSNAIGTSTNPLIIGIAPWDLTYWYVTGRIDEVRVSATARPACWIQTAYNNQSAPSAFYSISTEENQAGDRSITASAGSNGSISPAGAVTVAFGADQTFTITPAAGYEIAEVQVDGSAVTVSGGQYTFANVTDNHTISATFSPASGFDWGSSNFLYRRALTVDHTKVGSGCSLSLLNFPVLVSIQDAGLKSVANGGHVNDGSGYDIVFKSEAGTSLFHEVESYDGVTGSLTAWLRVPTLSNTANTTIYMYYGNDTISNPTESPTGVWDTNYLGVWHLGDLENSTGISGDGGNTATTAAAGKIGSGRYYDGNNSTGIDTTLTADPGNYETISAWVRWEATPNTNFPRIVQRNNGVLFFMDSYYGDHQLRTTYLGDTLGSTVLAEGVWYYVVMTTDNTLGSYKHKFYVNDAAETMSADSTNNVPGGLTTPYIIGNNFDGTRPWKGLLDEVRISQSISSLCWIQTEYNNQSAPGTFLSLGAEETNGTTHTVTATAGSNGSISPAGGVSVVEGGSQTFFFSPDAGYEIDDVLVDGSPVTVTNNRYTLGDVTGDHTIHVSFVSAGGFDWDTGSFAFRKPITIDHTRLGASCSTNISGFPVMIKIANESRLKSAANGGHVSHPQGYDIVFKDSSDLQLVHELESYDGTTGTLVAWVLIPTLSKTVNTTLYIYYGNDQITTPTENPTAVWDENFMAVWHLAESPADGVAGSILDSTVNANHGQPLNISDGGGGSTDAAGIADGADKFAGGQNDRIEVPDDPSLSQTNTVMAQCWVKFDTVGSEMHLVRKRHDLSPWNSFNMGVTSGRAPYMQWATDNGGAGNWYWAEGAGNSINTGTWYHIAVSHAGTTMRVYLDGNQVGSATTNGSALDTNDVVNIGAQWDGDNGAPDGVMDEVRISDVVRSQCWLQTEYANIGSPSTFYSVGVEESAGTLYQIVVGKGSGGSISPSSTVTVPEGGGQSFTITPDAGYEIDTLLVDGINTSAPGGIYTFSNVTDDHTIYVTFKAASGFDWEEGVFGYRKPIIIDHTKVGWSCSASLDNFPVLISLVNDADLKSNSNGGDVASANGYDIIFKNSSDNTLSHEIEKYDPTTGTLVAWVKIPTLSNTADTTIFIYYGNSAISAPTENPDSVWNSSYKGVWHLRDTLDSTSNQNHGTNNGASSVSGKIGNAYDFEDNDRDYIRVSHNSSLNTTDAITIEAWIKLETYGEAGYGVIFDKDYISGYCFNVDDATDTINFWANDVGIVQDANNQVLSLVSWYHVAVTYDRSNVRFYVNGEYQGGGIETAALSTNSIDLLIGSGWDSGSVRWDFDGLIDEVRLSSTARSQCWIQTEYNNQNWPSTFYSVGTEESGGSSHTIVASSGPNGSITPAGAVTVDHGGSKTFTFAPNAGYELNQVVVDGAVVEAGGSEYTFSGVSVNHTITVTFVQSGSDWPADTFIYRKALTIDHTRAGASCSGSTLFSFPVLVTIENDTTLKTSSNGGHVESAEGYDMLFRDDTGTPLFHEVEHYDGSNGTLVAWVRIPQLSTAADTTIYMYYGSSDVTTATEKPDDVWDATFAAVWHLSESPSDGVGGHADSSGNANTATPHNFQDGGGGTTAATGKIAGADFFKGDDDWVQAPNSTSVDITGDQITLSAWVNSTVNQNDDGGFVIKSDGNNYNYQLGIQAADTPNFRVRTSAATSQMSGPTALQQNRWYFIYGIYNGSTAKVYVDGVEENSANNSGSIVSSGSVPVVIGRRTIGDDRFFEGYIDEARIANTARSVCWMQTEYSNQNAPGTFISVGGEEIQGTNYTITAGTAGNGSITPAGEVRVAEGGSKTFTFEPANGYQIGEVKVDGAVTTVSGSQYTFSGVTADHTIDVSFIEAATTGQVDDEYLTGCSQNLSFDYSGGFNAEDLNLTNVALEDGHLVLHTGNQAIDPNHIVIPFRQEVAVYFLFEGAGYKRSDFGWMLASAGSSGTKHEVYQNVNDNNANGVLDVGEYDSSDRYIDINGDGAVNALDNRQVLGTFEAGTELAFYLKVDNEGNTYYTKTDWNPDVYGGGDDDEDEDDDDDECDFDNWTTKSYWLGRENNSEGDCRVESNWMTGAAISRADALFGLTFDTNDLATLQIKNGQKFSHVIVGAPASKPNEWILGWEDLEGGGDTDHNDMVFIIERETGGTAQLIASKAVTPSDPNAFITGATVGVWDYMPCAGKTDITYYVSVDAGVNWVEITAWDEVYEFTVETDGTLTQGAAVADWTPGSPAYTFRKRRVDFSELGLNGRELIWKAEYRSREEGCEPKTLDISLDISVVAHGYISRSSPVVLANVLYVGNMETPDMGWTDDQLRGHLFAKLIYDPLAPTVTRNETLWDAGEQLSARAPSSRTIYAPNIALTAVSDEMLATGDGTTRTFSGTLAHHPVSAATLVITDTRESFHDEHTRDLDGSLGGTGTINRYSGEYSVTFNTPPDPGVPVRAGYTYYQTSGTLLQFSPTNVAADGTANKITPAMLGLDNSQVLPSNAYVYDLDGDADFDTDDAKWLVNWVRGYADGVSTAKSWLLGAIDHSIPAVAAPPAFPNWYYGTAISENERLGFADFMTAHATRPAVIYVGSRDGMLHAFDAGSFRHGDNSQTASVTEERGYFRYEDLTAEDPDYCTNDSYCPDYGSGEELWAFIPANLLARLKNNLLQGDDKAFVDASPALADVYVNGAWRTVLLSAEGNGGDTVFCLDVTDPSNPVFMWEFADPDLFRSRSSPSVAQIGRLLLEDTTRWVAFFVSGKTYDDTLYPSIYIIDIANGSVIQRVVLDAEPAGIGGVLSGQPTIVDSDGNGYVDRVYIGSDKGYMYKINIPDSPKAVNYEISHCVINTDFSDDFANEIDEAQRYHPIYGSPVAVLQNSLNTDGSIDYNVLLFFGTGDSPYYDEDINTADTTYHFFAYRDRSGKGECDDNSVELDWFYELPSGHRIWASAFAAAGNIYFGTSTAETEDPCEGALDAGSGEGELGAVFAFDLSGVQKWAKYDVGNIVVSPLVEDEHLYVQSQTGGIDSFGSASYNNKVQLGGTPQVVVQLWKELF